jgi:Gas vesicle protein G
MFILDSLFISGLRFVLDKVATAADAQLNDDSVLREELLAAEMRRESGEISNAEFAEIEADLLARIREIKERREGGSGPIAFGREEEALDATFQVEATVSGDFHERSDGVTTTPPATRGKRRGAAPGTRSARTRRSRSPR